VCANCTGTPRWAAVLPRRRCALRICVRLILPLEETSKMPFGSMRYVMLMLLLHLSGIAQIGPPQPTPLPNAQVGVFYSSSVISAQCLAAQCTYSVTGGNLPPGLTLNTSSGVISGTPVTSGAFVFSDLALIAPPPEGGPSGTGGEFSITVAQAGPAGVPISATALLVMMIGLVAVALFWMRQPQRS